MKKGLFKKGFVLGIIVLFIGISVQPAIAVTPKASISEDECDICPAINKIKSLVEKNENKKLTNIIDDYLEGYSNSKLDNPPSTRFSAKVFKADINPPNNCSFNVLLKAL